MNEIMCIIRQGEEQGLAKEAICASLCYEMARQEMETNAGYSHAFAYLLANGRTPAATAAENGDELIAYQKAVKRKRLREFLVAPLAVCQL